MYKTAERQTEKRITVSDNDLAAMLGCGRSTAVEISKQAGARVRIGKRCLNKIDKIDAYLNAMAGE